MKLDMDHDDISFYQQAVLNLSLSAKLIEKMIAEQMLRYLEESNVKLDLSFSLGTEGGNSTKAVLSRLI